MPWTWITGIIAKLFRGTGASQAENFDRVAEANRLTALEAADGWREMYERAMQRVEELSEEMKTLIAETRKEMKWFHDELMKCQKECNERDIRITRLETEALWGSKRHRKLKDPDEV